MIWFINGYLLQQGAKQNWDDGSTRESSLAPVGVALFSGEGTSECLAPFLLPLSLSLALSLSSRFLFSPYAFGVEHGDPLSSVSPIPTSPRGGELCKPHVIFRW